MMREGRIKYFAAADYRENSEIENLVKAIILKTKANEDLEQIHYRNKKEHMDASRGVSDLEKQNAIIALENSSNFANSRSAVEILRGYSDWTQAEIETLADIALKNSQVKYILKDSDVKAFYENLLEKACPLTGQMQELKILLEE